MDVFTADLERRFAASTARELRSRFPAETRGMPDGELAVAVDRWFAQAASYGLLFERDLRRYAAIAARLGEDPGASAATRWVDAILRRDDESSGRRLDQIEAALGRPSSSEHG